ncbi:MAG TPA: hypothetical protein VG937_18790, partial [Polyangiaceae bacterium]|nr:hypothetical protein [Polyangiaceae bacterium]
MEQPQEPRWHWLTPTGTEEQGTLSDLRTRLLSQTLPASTWVWSTTWTEWIQATRVAELASALQPIARRPLKKPKRDPQAQRPPSQRPNEEAARVPPDPGTAREPLPTLGDEAQSVSPSNTLRPPGAVPPPPRPVPQLVKPEARPARSAGAAIATPIPSVFVGGQRDSAATLASGLDAPHAVKRETLSSRPDTLHEIEARSGVRGAARGAAPAPKSASAVDAKAAAATPARTAKHSRERAALWLLSLACAGLALGLALALSALSSGPSAAPAAIASAPTSALLPAHAPGCTLLVPAAKLAPSVERSVEPYFLNLSPDHVAVGFAKTKTEAAGSVIDLNSLDQSAVFEEAGERAVLGVVPTRA